MKVALVHDYIKEFGGAERVLRVLSDMYPGAPIYTAFKVSGSSCAKEFSDRKIIESPLAFLVKYGNLYSPLRFLAPLIWWLIDLSDYDLVITSCSSYFARGFRVSPKTKVVAYCHTPPRFLYGYETSINLQKYWIVRMYAVVVNHFLRLFDLWSSQRVDKWLANSENVRQRIRKFYRREAEIVYPPVEVEKLAKLSQGKVKESYFLVVSRLVGAKGLVESAMAARHLKLRLKIVGEATGFSSVRNRLQKMVGVELLGRVPDRKLWGLYAKARGFLALARDEDFGMTVVEAMAAGTPVIAFNGGGFKESVVPGKTGLLIDGTDETALERAFKKFENVKWRRSDLVTRARRYSKRVFVSRMREVIAKIISDER